MWLSGTVFSLKLIKDVFVCIPTVIFYRTSKRRNDYIPCSTTSVSPVAKRWFNICDR